MGDTFERHKEEMTTCVEPVENDLSITSKAKEQLGVQMQELDDQGAAVKAGIQQEIRQLQEVLEERKVELFNRVDQHVERKKKNLAAQMDEVETIETQQMSCLSCERELEDGKPGRGDESEEGGDEAGERDEGQLQTRHAASLHVSLLM